MTNRTAIDEQNLEHSTLELVNWIQIEVWTYLYSLLSSLFLVGYLTRP